MSELVEKPQEGFQTPYQLILDLTANRVMSRINNENIVGINLADRWVGIKESEVDITVPEEMAPETSKAHWKLTVTSDSRGVVTTPVRFYTFTLGEYLKEVLGNKFKNYGRNRITEEGFYYTEEGEVIFGVKYSSDLTKEIKHSGVEFKSSMYTISTDGEMVFINTPVVKGELHLFHIN